MTYIFINKVCGDRTGEAWNTHAIDALNSFIEGTWCSYVLDNGKRELVAVLGVRLPDLCGRLFTSDCTSHIITMVEELIQNVGGDEA